MDFNPVMWALCRGGGGNSGGGSGGGGDNFPIGDGNTHIWISLAEGRTSPMVGLAVNGTVTVDWGDGSEPDTLTGTSTSAVVYTPVHEYGKAGDYVITLIVDGEICFIGISQGTYLLVNTANMGGGEYRGAIQKCEFADTGTILGAMALGLTPSLTSVKFPADAVAVPDQMFYSCTAIRSVTIPEGITTVGVGAFRLCSSLVNVHFPNSVMNISKEAFYQCRGVGYYDFSKHTNVPTLMATSAFQLLPADCQIRVPAALADEWKAATNWATYADYIVGV